MRSSTRFRLAIFLGMAAAWPARAQTQDGANFVRSVWMDEGKIFSSPAHLHKKDLTWLLPAAGAAAFLFSTDRGNMQDRIHTNPLARDRSEMLSNVGVGSLAAIPALLEWQGWRNRDHYQQETGWLAARAVVDTLVTTEILQVISQRERPTATGGGDFFRSGTASSSFPSMHAASAWALASVVAHRYPGWLTKVAVYGLAGGVTVGRVLARDHSPSDVAVGSGLGWLIGRFVAGEDSPPRKLFRPTAQASSEQPSTEPGSTYVPVDSWIYPALDRLAAFGLIPSQTSGLRPWTRAECLRQVREAASRMSSDFGVADELVRALRSELENPTGKLTLNSIYTRNGGIAGPDLNDSFHFGQTWINDSGRPFGRGFDSYTGFTASGESGPFFAYVNGEYQHAPGTEPYSLPVRQTIANLDFNPLQPAAPDADTNRFRFLDTYAGVRLGDFEISLGKQSLWWGPTADSPLSFSDNAEPTKNLRISTVHPIRLPGLLRYLGEIRGEFVFGKLGGQQYTWRPWFNAQKLTFKLTENLEMGFTRWSILWGVGHPITVESLLRNFTSLNSPNGPSGVGASDPGDRKGGFDFRYRIPGLRNWLTLYSDSYSDDDPSPLAAPRRAAINPGIYLTHVPGIPRLDFRVEAPSTMPMEGDQGGTFIYYNDQYHSGNTNYGYLVGNPVGRDARAIEGWATYWLSARNKIEASFRQVKGGSTQTDATLKNSFPIARDLRADLMLQYERFLIPLLGGPQRNLSGWVQLTWEPEWRLIR